MPLDSYLLRHATPEDLPALYRVCLKTGDSGKDASAIQDDPDLLGEFYVGPYVMLEPDLAYALDSSEGPIGYLLGVLDTATFNGRLERDWLPRLKKAHQDPVGDPAGWHGSDWVRHAVHHPFLKVPAALKPYPSHAHIDLLCEARGQGVGRHLMQTMMERLTELGSPGLHLQVSPKNRGAQDFYRGLGFEALSSPDLPDDTLFMARRLGEPDGED
jgi:ribosomal protein S18 acetylase RimI-like enzyme